MSGVDITLTIIILLGIYSGYGEGFLISLISLLAIVLGILGGFKLMGYAMILLTNRFNIDNVILPYISFGIIFILIVIAVSLIGKAIKASIDKNFLGKVDQIIGAILGLLRVVFLTSVAIWILNSMRIAPDEKWTAESWLYPKIAIFAPSVTTWLAKLIPAFKDVF